MQTYQRDGSSPEVLSFDVGIGMALRQLFEAKNCDSQTMPTKDFADKAENTMSAVKEAESRVVTQR